MSSGETVQMPSLAWALAARICYKNQNLRRVGTHAGMCAQTEKTIQILRVMK